MEAENMHMCKHQPPKEQRAEMTQQRERGARSAPLAYNGEVIHAHQSHHSISAALVSLSLT